MTDVIFENSPHISLLHKLARGPLEQTQNLSRAIRQWANLRWLYSEGGYTALPDSFTFTEWREAFYSSTHPPGEKLQEVLSHEQPECACTKTTIDWLSNWGMPVEEWRQSLLQQISICDADLDKLLKERLFAQTRKSLQDHLDHLETLGLLKLAPSEFNRSKNYCRVKVLPGFDEPKNLGLSSNFTTSDLADLAQALDMLSFLDPKLSPLAEQISEQVYGTRRVFLHIDYIVPQAIQDEVDDLQEQLQQIWRTAQTPPVLLTYDSAHLSQVKECVVYPVCIYYVQRAKYLCAYGSDPKGQINWYNYRLDRIRCKRLVELSWSDPRVPQLLLEKYQSKQLPSPEEVKTNMEKAWGFDFYRKSSLMLLRFDRDFHDRYIQGTFRHDTFTSVTYDEATNLLQQETQNPEQQQSLLEILQSRSRSDAYYKAIYRVNDNNVVMRLRAWGAKVEVLLPWDLRQRMTKDVLDTWSLYK